MTAHEEFHDPDFTVWRRAGVEVVLDGRNAWQQDVVEQAGILYFGVGRRPAGWNAGLPGRRRVPLIRELMPMSTAVAAHAAERRVTRST